MSAGGFVAGYYYGKNGGDCGGLAVGLIILMLIIALVMGGIKGVGFLVKTFTAEDIAYESVVVGVEAERDGKENKATYYVVFTNSFGEEDKTEVSYQDYKMYSESVGETLTVEAVKHGLKKDLESDHKVTLRTQY